VVEHDADATVGNGSVAREAAVVVDVHSSLSVTLACWVLLELGVRVRESVRGRGRTGHDRFTRVLIAITTGAAIALAVNVSPARSLGVAQLDRAAGLVIMWLGLAIRVWAIAALGKDFRTTVEVDPGQAVVSSGPYSRIRHPSYAGLLLVLAGFGLALGNWRSLCICTLLPLPGLLLRIRVEEAEMTRVLGDAYRDYQKRTKRLIPGVW
jgi:protein-S-isoprenylcysteine O-methyltransferase Ste14